MPKPIVYKRSEDKTTLKSLFEQLEPLQSINGDFAIEFEHRLEARCEKGKKEYGCTIDEAGLNSRDLVEHALEELEDAMIYLKASEIENSENSYQDVIERLYKIWIQIANRRLYDDN